MFKYILERAKETSTWRGLVLLATAIGVTLTPEQKEAVIALGLAIAGALGAFTPDSKKG